jgi:hypothetical protein
MRTMSPVYTPSELVNVVVFRDIATITGSEGGLAPALFVLLESSDKLGSLLQ